MQVFEFHFNPKAKKPPSSALLVKTGVPDLIFDSFCYEPENIYEKRLGSLYLVGELKNVLPNDLNFLEKISQFIKTRYYNYYLKTPEEALRECLKGLNEFLTREVKKENVNWLGNLKLAVISLCPNQKNGGGDLNFSKIGDIKIFLLRGGKINEISKNLNFQEIEPYPLKIFSNIVSGKLIEEDVLLVLTQGVSSLFVEKSQIDINHNQKTKKNKDLVFSESLLEKIAKIIPFKEKGLKEILKTREKEFSKTSGICLLIHFSKKEQLKEFFTFREKPKEVSLSNFLLFLRDKLVKVKEDLSSSPPFAAAREVKEDKSSFPPFAAAREVKEDKSSSRAEPDDRKVGREKRTEFSSNTELLRSKSEGKEEDEVLFAPFAAARVVNGFLKRKLSRITLIFSRKTAFPKISSKSRPFSENLKIRLQVKIPLNLKRNFVLILILILFLLLGFLIFRLEPQREIRLTPTNEILENIKSENQIPAP